MDPMALLDVEKRTGISNDEIDDFLSRVTSAESQIKALMEGTIRPEEVVVDDEYYAPGLEEKREQKKRLESDSAPSVPTKSVAAAKPISQPATATAAASPAASRSSPPKVKAAAAGEKATPASSSPAAVEDEVDAAARREAAVRKLEETKAARQAAEEAEEKRKWWDGAELFYGNAEEPTGESAGAEDGGEAVVASEAKEKTYDPLDYARWDEWVKNPDDPVSKEEADARQKEVDRLRDDEFEKANPEFCDQVRTDIGKRKSDQETRKRRAARAKAEGNDHFKRKRYGKALSSYMQALKSDAFSVPILTNIAQAHLKLESWERAVEFCSRALYIDAECSKALYRRGVAHHKLRQFKEAVQDLRAAATLQPESKDTQKALAAAEVAFRAHLEETQILASANAVGERTTADSMDAIMQAGMFQAVRGTLSDMAAFLAVPAPEGLAAPGPERKAPTTAGLGASLAALADVLGEERDARLYLRAVGALPTLATGLRTALVAASESPDAEKLAAGILRCVAAAAEEPASHSALRDAGALAAALRVLTDSPAACGGSVHAAAMEVVEGATTVDRSRTVIRAHPDALAALLRATSASDASTAERAGNGVRNLCMAKATAFAGLQPVPALAAALAGMVGRGSRAWMNAREAVVGALVNVGKAPEHSLAVTEPVPVGAGGEPATIPAVTVVRLLETPSMMTDTAEEHSLAVALNAFVANPGRLSVLALAFAKSGTLGLLLDRLCCTGDSRPLTAQAAARAGKIVSRCCTAPAGRRAMVGEAARCVRLAGAGAELRWRGNHAALSTEEGERQWVVRESFASALALLLGTETVSAAVWGDIDVSECVRACCDALARAGTELEAKRDAKVLAANASKLAIELLKGGRVEDLHAGGATRALVAILANGSDGPVRKNAAIALARLARNEAALAEIRELRGMEMLVQMGKDLL